MLQALATIGWAATGIAAGIGEISFWWVLIPTFLAGTFGLANGPHFAAVIDANKRGNLWLFPTQLAIYWAGNLIGATIVYWVTHWIAS